ncbi:MAG: hypothetical protein V4673_00515 [Pseudomonadota bacterium]
MSHLKLASACTLALLLAATAAHAGQKTRTKSNNSNDREAPEGVVLQDSAAAANGCFTGTGAWSWAAVSSVGALAGGGSGAAAASYARTGSIETDLRPVCDSAQTAIDRINADAAKLAALDAAVAAGDEAAIRRLLIENGLPSQLATGAQFHAINTKGTGATNGRMSRLNDSASDEAPQAAVADIKIGEMPNRISMNVTVARTTGGLSFTVSRSIKNKNGHVTLNR